MFIKRLAIFVLSLSLFSCAVPYVKENVTKGNWEALGVLDAEKGQVKKSPEYLKKLLDEYNSVTVDYHAYEKAYNLGLDTYCELENAFLLGLAEQPYIGVCRKYPNAIEFYERWNAGRRLGSAPNN